MTLRASSGKRRRRAAHHAPNTTVGFLGSRETTLPDARQRARTAGGAHGRRTRRVCDPPGARDRTSAVRPSRCASRAYKPQRHLGSGTLGLAAQNPGTALFTD
jgi:hypothetical protein